MLPEGVIYHASWIDPVEACCFQLMEADDAGTLQAWASRWDDLADFQIVPVLTSQDYWAGLAAKKNRSGYAGPVFTWSQTRLPWIARA